MPEPPRPGLDLDDCSFGSCDLRLSDYAHAIQHEPRTRTLLRWATVAGALTLPLGIALLTTPRLWLGLGLCAFGVACFAAHGAPDQAAARWYARTPSKARSLRYTLNTSGLIVVTDVSQRAYPWRALEGFHAAPEAFLVWVSSRSFLILPKRAFQADDLPRVAERLGRELGAPPELPRYWSWLALAVGLVGAALAAWNWLDPR